MPSPQCSSFRVHSFLALENNLAGKLVIRYFFVVERKLPLSKVQTGNKGVSMSIGKFRLY